MGESGAFSGTEEGVAIVGGGFLNGGGGGGIALRSRSCFAAPSFPFSAFAAISTTPFEPLCTSSISSSGISQSCIKGASSRGFLEEKIKEGRCRMSHEDGGQR